MTTQTSICCDHDAASLDVVMVIVVFDTMDDKNDHHATVVQWGNDYKDTAEEYNIPDLQCGDACTQYHGYFCSPPVHS